MALALHQFHSLFGPPEQNCPYHLHKSDLFPFISDTFFGIQFVDDMDKIPKNQSCLQPLFIFVRFHFPWEEIC